MAVTLDTERRKERSDEVVLTDEQREIVEFFGAPMRVLAGPGTGKTLCLIERINFLIEQKRVSHNEIYAITFTKAAAGELRKRLERRGIKSDGLPYVNTLHGLAMSILRSHLKRAGLKAGFRPIDGVAQRILVKDVIQDLKEKNINLSGYDVRIYITAHFQNKAKAGIPKHFSDNPRLAKILTEFSKSFHDNLDFYNAIDWAEILHKTIDLLDSHEDIKNDTHSKVRHLLVDEYQDLSPLEQYFVDKIVGNSSGLCIVGDDDQSIYETFRFADPKGIIDFTEKYKGAKPFFISLCRRCPPEVIKCASNLIKNNKKRVEKELLPFNEKKKGFVVALSHKSKKAEMEWLVSKIPELLKKEFEYKDILILFTDGDIAKDYVLSLKAAGVPLDIQLKVSNIFNSEYFIWLMATIRWLVNKTDNLSMRQCLDYWKGIGPETVRQLKLQALSTHSTLWDAVESVANNPKAFKKIKQRNKVVSFHRYITKLEETKRFSELVEQFFMAVPESKEDKGCNIFLKHLDEFEDKEDMVTLKEVLEDFEQHVDSGELESKYQSEQKGVRIMSMHAAKGCESPVVIMPALEDDVMPGENADNIEEKRRLFYVSLTRAKYGVYLSWASQRSGQEIHKIEGRKMLGKKKSRFLYEIK